MADTGMTVGLIKALAPKPSTEDIAAAVDAWLDDHPEATTTVQDGSITKAKLDSNLQGTVDDVTDLKSQIDELQDYLYIDDEACAVRSTTDNTALMANGNQTSNTNAEIVTYIVKSGDNIHIIAAGGTAGVFQFSSDSAISAKYRVGETITTAFDGYVTVPQNARFLHVSKLKSATGNSVTKYHVVINSMMDDIHDAMSGVQPIYKIDSNADFVIGKLGSDYQTLVTDNHRVVNTNIIYPARDVQFTIDNGYQYAVCTYDTNGNWLESDTGFISVNYNLSKGYGFRIIIRKNPEQNVIDIYEYLNALKVFTLQGNLVEELSNAAKLSHLVKTPWIQEAHRGIVSGTIVENTIASYEEAYKAGFTRIECDIRLTSDNEIVVVHDETISGTVDGVATTYTVADTPWNTLKQLVLADDPVYGEQTIPKFEDVLAWAYYRNVDLNVDFKDRIVPISDAALLIKRNGMSGKVTYNTNSYSTESSDVVFQHDPKACILFVYNSTIIAELNTKNYDKRHIIIYPANPNQTIINEIRDNGYTLLLADVYSTENLGYKADIVEYARQTVYEINEINQSFMNSLDY